MQTNFGQNKPEVVQGNPGRGRVVVSLHPVRESVRLDIDGNQIDPRTKKILRLAKDVI